MTYSSPESRARFWVKAVGDNAVNVMEPLFPVRLETPYKGGSRRRAALHAEGRRQCRARFGPEGVQLQ